MVTGIRADSGCDRRRPRLRAMAAIPQAVESAAPSTRLRFPNQPSPAPPGRNRGCLGSDARLARMPGSLLRRLPRRPLRKTGRGDDVED
jgi:hypothetical protein